MLQLYRAKWSCQEHSPDLMFSNKLGEECCCRNNNRFYYRETILRYVFKIKGNLKGMLSPCLFLKIKKVFIKTLPAGRLNLYEKPGSIITGYQKINLPPSWGLQWWLFCREHYQFIQVQWNVGLSGLKVRKRTIVKILDDSFEYLLHCIFPSNTGKYM